MGVNRKFAENLYVCNCGLRPECADRSADKSCMVCFGIISSMKKNYKLTFLTKKMHRFFPLMLFAVSLGNAYGYGWTDPETGITWDYGIIDGFSRVNGVYSGNDLKGVVAIPSKINDYPAKWIQNQAFWGKSEVTEFIVPEGVVWIGTNAFMSCTSLTKISLPSTLTCICDRAFNTCTALESIELPRGVVICESQAFKSCTSLKSISVEEGNASLRSSGSMLLRGNELIAAGWGDSSLVIPEGVEKIAGSVFYGDTTLTSVVYPSTLKEIGEESFRDCSGLKYVSLPEGFVTLGSMAFYNCASLVSATLPSTLIFKDYHAFSKCGNLKSVLFRCDLLPGIDRVDFKEDNCVVYVLNGKTGWTVPGKFYSMNVVYLESGEVRTAEVDGRVWKYMLEPNGELTLVGCTAGLTGEVAFPQFVDGMSVSRIGDSAFRENYNLRGVNIPVGVLRIGRSAFERCEGIERVKMPISLCEIGSSAFRECTSLSSVQIPMSVATMGAFAFRDCRSLRSLEIANPALHTGVGAFDGTPADVKIEDGLGFICVVTEVCGAAVSIPETWKLKFPLFSQMFGSDFPKALMRPSGKVDYKGAPMYVWQDFVAGTDPTDVHSKFRAIIEMESGSPKISCQPELSEEERSLRKYTVLGKVRLSDSDWVEVGGNLSEYNFFKVLVEMK